MEKVTEFKQKLFSPFRIAALLLVSLALSVTMQNFDNRDNARIDSMSPTDYIAYMRHLHSQGFAAHFVGLLVIGAIYPAIVETITFVLRRAARAK